MSLVPDLKTSIVSVRYLRRDGLWLCFENGPVDGGKGIVTIVEFPNGNTVTRGFERAFGLYGIILRFI